MLVFYLDFDGVVTTDRYRDLMGQCLNPFLVAEVVALAREAGAKVVVSSTWRVGADCQAKMQEAGFPLDLLHADWRTPLPHQVETDLATGEPVAGEERSRGQEIDLHARRNGVEAYLVLDDDLG